MLDFMTAGLFKRLDDGSVYFFPFSRKRGYQLEPTAAARVDMQIKICFIAGLGGMFASQLLLSDLEAVGFIGSTAMALVGYYVAVYRTVAGRPRSSVTLSREEQRASVLRAQPVLLLVGLGVFGLLLAGGAILLYDKAAEVGLTPILCPISAVYGGLGLFFFVWSLRLMWAKRKLGIR